MKIFNYFALSALVLSVACKADKKADTVDSSRQDSISLVEKARKIHDNVITIDTHNDIDVKNFTDSLNYTMDLETQVNLPKMEKGGLDVSWLIVYTGQDSLNADGYAKAYDNAMAKFNAIHRLCEEIAPDRIDLALTSDDVRRIHDSGKLVAMIGVENAYPVGTDLSNIKKFHDLGGRYMSLSHNGHSQFCDSNTGEKDSIWIYNGLSDLGKQAIAEMNKWGIMIDLSHPSAESNKQAIKLSKAPVIASHSSARALCNHSRNLSDEELLLIRDNGGVVQTVAFSAYVNTEKDKAPNVRVNVSDFADHIDHMVNLIGIDHVGISSDFDGGGGIEGWDDASETFNITLELVKRGYTEEDIRKLWGDNLLRVLDEVQETARELQAAEDGTNS